MEKCKHCGRQVLPRHGQEVIRISHSPEWSNPVVAETERYCSETCYRKETQGVCAEKIDFEKYNEQLKPCPLCRSKAKFIYTGRELDNEGNMQGREVSIKCSNCRLEYGSFFAYYFDVLGTMKEAMHGWNERL